MSAIYNNCRSLFQWGLSSPAATTPVPVVNPSKVSEWIQRFDACFSKLEKITQNGLYSLIEKQVKQLTPLLEEGKAICSSTPDSLQTSAMIDQLLKPRFSRLTIAYQNEQKRIAENSAIKEEDVKIEKKWETLALPPPILERHADCARFLIESGLAFTLVGYRESCLGSEYGELKLDTDGHPMVKVRGRFVRWETVGDPNIDYLKLDGDGHPMIKMKGHFVRWETLSRELYFDAKSENIKSKSYPGSLAQVWNYCYHQGLVPIDRFNYERAFPIYELTQAQYDRTKQHALKFYETQPEKDIGIPKDCIVQFVTSPRQQLPAHPLLKNANEQYPMHIGMRLITRDRKVYSFGVHALPEAVSFIFSDLASNFLATADAKIAMHDYDEFRPHEGKVVTSIPLTSQRSQNILNFVNELNSKQLRFQYARQNCTIAALEVLRIAGYDLDLRTTGLDCIYAALPSLNQLPVIGSLVAKVEYCAERIWKVLPKIVTDSIESTRNVALYLPKKFLTVGVNLLMWKLGAAKKITPLQDGLEDEEFYNKRGIQTFSSVIRSWADIFKGETSVIHSAALFLPWQKAQKSTFIDPYRGRPTLSIVPPTPQPSN